MNIDDRIQNIMKKMEKLSSKHPEDTCGEFPPKWGEPLTEQDVVRFEKEMNLMWMRGISFYATRDAACIVF